MFYLKKIYIFLILSVIFIASNYALLNFSHLYSTHDVTHAARIAEMTRALEDGHFPVRWTENFAFGWGMPLFEFYAPLPFYVGSFLYWLGLNIESVIKILYIISGLITLLGSYKFASRLFGKQAGLVAAAAFTLAPYRAVNIFVRGAISEAWGIMAMPWILLGIVLVIENRKNKKSWILLIFSLLVLMLSHNVSTVMFLPISLCFAAFYLIYSGALNWKKTKTLSKITSIISAYLISIGIAAFYLFPAFLEKDFTKVSSIFEDYFQYSNHFLYIRQFFNSNWGYGGSTWGPEDGISFFLGYGQLLALFFSLLILFLAFFKTIKTRANLKSFLLRNSLYIFIILIFMFSLYLTTFKSIYLWQSLPLISYIQFPWRWLSIAILFLALITAYFVSLIKNKPKKYLVSLVLIFVILLNGQYFKFDKTNKTNSLAWEFACTNEICVREKMSQVLPDYIYIGQKSDLKPIIVEQIFNCNDEEFCKQNIDLIVNRGHEKLFKTNFTSAEKLNLNIAAFPGWQVELDGEKQTWEEGEQGNIVVALPAGEHQLGVYFGYTQVRFVSDIVSVISLLILLYLIIDIKKT